MNRNLVLRSLAAVVLLGMGAQAASAAAAPAAMPLSPTFKKLKAPETGRAAVQLTTGNAFCYPLYYFIPTFTKDARYLIHHRAEAGQVQLWRLDLQTGQSVQLTRADCPDTQWKPWCVDSGRGVLDHRSVLNVARGLVIYFDGNKVRTVHVETLKDEPLFEIPADREAIGQNCCTPDGKYLVYIHTPRGSIYRKPCQGAAVVAYDFDTRQQKVLTTIDSPIHHVLPYDNEHFLFCHPFDHTGMMMTDLTSGKWTELRQGDPGARGHLCHFLATARGIAYEVPGKPQQVAGLYDPLTRRRFEFLLPTHFGYSHTGWDPEGRLWFFEESGKQHDLWFLVRVAAEAGKDNTWLKLTGHWPTYGKGQKSHFHPQLTPDRRWILMTGGDPATQTNHLFLLDASDLKDTEGISADLLSPTGANNRTAPATTTAPAATSPGTPATPPAAPRTIPAELLEKRLPAAAITDSGHAGLNGPANAADGDLATLWAAEGDGPWLQFDLGEPKAIGRILVAWHAGAARKARFDLAVSDDGKTWNTVFSGASSGTIADPEPVDMKPVTARYVRLTGHGNSINKWNSLAEVFILHP